MKKAILFCFISFLFCSFRSDNNIVTKIFACEHISEKGENFKDYIVFIYDGNTISKGTYYGNMDDFHYVADISFREITEKYVSFFLEKHRFTNDAVTPFTEPKYVKGEDWFIDLYTARLQGSYNDEQLHLLRVYDIYDGRADRMIFNLVAN